MGMRRGRKRDERGAAAVEFALIAPLLLLLVFGIIDFGWMLMKASLVNNATRDAARVASLSGTYDRDREQRRRRARQRRDRRRADVDRVDLRAPTRSGSNCDNTAASYDANATSGSTVTVTVTLHPRLAHPDRRDVRLVGGDSCVGDTIVLERTAQMVTGVTMASIARIRDRRRSERGAVAVLFAALVVVLFAVAALGVDIAQQVNRKHLLINQLDAASTAAAAKLGAQNGSIADAVAAATAFYAINGEGELDTAKIDFWCVVARELKTARRRSNPRGRRPPDPDRRPEPAASATPTPSPARTQVVQVQLPEPAARLGRPAFRHDVQRHALRGAVRAQRPARATAGTPATRIVNSRPDQVQHHPGRRRAGRPVQLRAGASASTRDPPAPRSRSRAPARAAPSPPTRWTWWSSPTAPCRCRTRRSARYTGASPCTDYRTSLVNGIKSMLQVMTPEQQYVALGALGPSERTRSTAESNAVQQPARRASSTRATRSRPRPRGRGSRSRSRTTTSGAPTPAATGRSTPAASWSRRSTASTGRLGQPGDTRRPAGHHPDGSRVAAEGGGPLPAGHDQRREQHRHARAAATGPARSRR